MGLVKIGYFRISGKDGERYVSFDEFKTWDSESRLFLREKEHNGTVKLFCACQSENTSELHITSTGVLRVAQNGQQAHHLDSCPKSESYAGYIASVKKGVISTGMDGDNTLLFNISLPTLVKSKARSSSSSEGTSTGATREKKTDLISLIYSINRYAWKIQNFSIKKKIREAKKEGVEPSWEYKNLEEFNRLFFGCCNDIFVKVRDAGVVPFISLCYRKELYEQCMDSSYQFFFYARVLRLSEYKACRKYQYVTVDMPSPTSATKSVIRIETGEYLKLFGDVEELNDNAPLMLGGYIRKNIYPKDDGTLDVWMTLTRGVVVPVNEYGLIVEKEAIRDAAEILIRRKVLFNRPFVGLENYGNEVPAVVIEQYNGKDILIDCGVSSSEYETRHTYTEDNEEFDCHLIKLDENTKEKVHQICDDYYRGRENGKIG